MLRKQFHQDRTRFLAGFVLVVMAIIIVRLFFLQIIDHNKYKEMAYSEQYRQFVLSAERGEIYGLDNGQPVKLVMNEVVYTVFADPQEVKDKAKVLEVINRVAGASVVKNASELMDDKKSRYKIIAKNITRQQAEMIKKEDLRGIGLQKGTQRVYPEGNLAAHTLGFVNNEGKGQYGVEQFLNDELSGKDGVIKSVTDVQDVPLTIGKDNINIPAQDGKNVVLTIDRNMQSKVEQALSEGAAKVGATEASAIVMDPNTGQIMAMANTPTFDPAKYGEVTNAAAFVNSNVSLPFEPASVIKTFFMAAGIDKGVINAQSTYTNTDSIQVEDRVINNALKGRTGTITMQQVLNWSLNTGTVTVAKRLGGGDLNRSARDIIYDYYHNKFGLGEITGIEVAGEAQGNVISPDKAEGNAVRYSNMTFGQGLNITMVQVAAGFSAMINGGNYYKPTVIAGQVDEFGEFKKQENSVARSGIISESTSSQMRDMTVVARKSFFTTEDRAGYMVGGKTGTSENLVNGAYTKLSTTGTYLGFGGDSAPKYVIMVRVYAPDKNLEGGIHAGPIFTDISNWMIEYMGLKPNKE